jgi:hypothetical protein
MTTKPFNGGLTDLPGLYIRVVSPGPEAATGFREASEGDLMALGWVRAGTSDIRRRVALLRIGHDTSCPRYSPHYKGQRDCDCQAEEHNAEVTALGELLAPSSKENQDG